MLERVTHNASGDIIDVYTDPDGIWPALCEAVLCLNVEWPRDNVLRLPLAASDGWDKPTDKLGHETEKRSGGDGLLAPAVGLEPSPEHLGLDDSIAIARKGDDRKTSLKRCESGLTAPLGTRVPDSHSIDSILAHARLAWGAMRVI